MCQHNRNVLHCPSLGKFMCFSSRDGQMEHAESHKSTGYNRKQEIRDRTPMCESLTNPPSPHGPHRLQTRTCLQWRKWKDTPGRCVFIWLRDYSDVRYCRSPNNANIHLHLCGPEERKSLLDSTCWLVQSQPHAGCFLRHLALFVWMWGRTLTATACSCVSSKMFMLHRRTVYWGHTWRREFHPDLWLSPVVETSRSVRKTFIWTFFHWVCLVFIRFSHVIVTAAQHLSEVGLSTGLTIKTKILMPRLGLQHPEYQWL